MDELLEHFGAARSSRGEEPCSCCKGTGEHEDRSECDRCDGSGAMHRGDDAALPWCPGRENDQPAPPRRRHWRESARRDPWHGEGPWYHGTPEAMEPGDVIQPGDVVGRQHMGRGSDSTRAWVTNDPWKASSYGTNVYEVEPSVPPKSMYARHHEHYLPGGGTATVLRQVPYEEATRLSPEYQRGARAMEKQIREQRRQQHEGARPATWFAAGRGLALTAAELFHGSDRDEPFSRFDFGRRSAKSEDEEESPLYKQEGEGATTRWWNSRLGSHFTSEHHVASEIAQRMGGGGNVYHVELRQQNPKHYASEHDLAEEAVGWARKKGYKGLRNLGFSWDQGGWHHAEALQNHPQSQEIAEGFRAHLQSQGHDGITYGNEYEGTRGHLSAIAFHPDQVKITGTHGGHDPCRYDEPVQHEAVLAGHPEYRPREEFDNEASERDPGYFDAYRNRKRAWSAHVKRGLSLGHLSGTEAKGLGYYFGGHETDSNGDPKWQPLPHAMYHATTDLPSVRQHGLKTRQELEQAHGGHGLGGGEDDTISVTTDHELGRGILHSLHEFHDVVNGTYTPQQMWAHAKAGTGAARPFHEDLSHHWDRSWKHGDPMPGGLHDALHGVHRQNEMGATQQDMDAKGPGWRPARGDEGWTTGHTPPRQAHAYWERDMTPDEHRENAAGFYKKFAAFREYAGGREDPNFFMTDEKAFAAKDPSKFALLHVRPRPGGQGYPMGGMREWRTGTGDALEVHHHEQLHGGQLHTAAFRRQAGNPSEYQMEMQPDEHGDPLHAMGGEHGEGDWPSDFYDTMRDYDDTHGEYGYAHESKIRRARGNPDKRVRIWRSAPALNPESRNAKKGEFNTGDWVTLNKPYAEADARSVNETSERNFKDASHPQRQHIWTTTVPARHVRSAGNSLMEWGYFGPHQEVDHSSEQCSHRNPFIKRERAPRRRRFEDTNYSGKHLYGARQHEGAKLPELHRGLAVAIAPEDHAVVSDARRPVHERARHLIDTVTREGLEPLGQHWTSDEKQARHFTQYNSAGAGPPGGTRYDVVLHAHHPGGQHVITDPGWREEHEVNDDEDEQPLERHTELEVHGISWRPRAGDEPWTRHRFGEPQWHEAFLRRQGGQRGDLPDLAYYHVRQGREKGGYHVVAAAHEGAIIGHLTWGPGRTKIQQLWVHPQYRRHGVADALYQRSQWVEPGLQHHTDRTEAGNAWATAAGGDLPEHLDDTTSGDADRHGEWTAGQLQQRLDSGHPTMKRLAVLPAPGLANPHTGGEEWYHGSQAHPQELSQHGFNDPADFDEGAFEELGSEPTHHWNTLLGTHFTADHDVAEQFAGGEHSSGASERHEGYPGVVHARLGLRNPKVYGSEHDMDHEAYEHEHAAGNHPSNHVPGLGRHGDADEEDDDELYEAEEMWPHAHQIAKDYGHGEIPASTYGHLRTPFQGHPMRTAWLSTHPDRWGIADRFKQRLKAQGHDGIIYGNEYEKSKHGAAANRSAIVFHPHQIQVTQHHAAGEPCRSREEGGLTQARLPGHGQQELPFHEGGKAGPLPDDLQFHYSAGEPDDQGYYRMIAHVPGIPEHPHPMLPPDRTQVGFVNWMHHDYKEQNPVDLVWTDPKWKRRGIATATWEQAVRADPTLTHARPQGTRPAGKEWKKSLPEHLAVFTPTQRIFGPTYGLDHRLFDEQERLRPPVRQALLGRLQGVLEPLLGQNWDVVTRVCLAGSEASRWTSPELEGNGDLDVLIGVAYSYARKDVPALAGMTDTEIDQHLNAALQQRFNAPGWHPPFGPDDTYDLTGYVNHRALDIRAINPYAAYDLTNDEWAVKPPDLPHWSAAQFPQGPALMQEARGLISQVRAILRLPEPFRTQEASRIWDYLHEGRKHDFTEQGLGWQGTGNVLEKALDQASGGLVTKLKQLKYGPADHAPAALGHGMTTADLEPARD